LIPRQLSEVRISAGGGPSLTAKGRPYRDHMDYVDVRRLHGNQTYLLAALLGHNLNRELQMSTRVPERRTNEKRCAL
jgi:hypothetical protein